MLTRRKVNKVLHGGHSFIEEKAFPAGKLPTAKDVIQRMLHENNQYTRRTAESISQELNDHWIWCNVYPIHHKTVTNKIYELMSRFSYFDRYPKKKRGPTFLTKLHEFIQTTEKLFDIFCQDPIQRRALEVKHQLRMSSDDFTFYHDQNGPRLGKCLKFVERLSSSDIRFQKKADIQHNIYSSLYTGAGTSAALTMDSQMHITDNESECSTDTGTTSSEEFAPPLKMKKLYESNQQNRQSLKNLARACDRFQLSDRSGAAIATSVLKDHGIVTDDNTALVIDRSKLRRERATHRDQIRKEEEILSDSLDGVYVDGHKDATNVILQANGKYYRRVELEEHYVVVGEPGEFYLTHVSPEDGKGKTIAQAIYTALEHTLLKEKLAVIGSDGTATMTGACNGAIRLLEEILQKPLQWAICLLHCNELPLRHVFLTLDGPTKGPDSFSGEIGRNLSGCVSEWDVTKFKPISNPNFPQLQNEIIDDLSTDQYYAYRICWAVILGHIDTDLEMLEIGHICHSRWLTLACRILRCYTSQQKPSPKLVTLAEFCVKVYFPTWFQIKQKHRISDGSKNFYDLLRRIVQFPNDKIKKIALRVIQRNAFFAHPENILLGMLADEDESVRRVAVNRIQVMRGNLASFVIEGQEEFEEGSIEQSEDDEQATGVSNNAVRRFLVPKLNIKAKSYHKLVNLNSPDIQQPPAIRNLGDTEIENIREVPLNLNHPCHNQAVERHVKLVTEASSSVSGFERRDGMIRQKIRSRKLMKCFDTKKQFA